MCQPTHGTSSIHAAQEGALAAPCPVCRAPRGEPCHAAPGCTHSARVALKLAELEATAPSPKKPKRKCRHERRRSKARGRIVLGMVIVGLIPGVLAVPALAAKPKDSLAVSTALTRAQKFGSVEGVSVAKSTLGLAEAQVESPMSLGPPGSSVEVVTVKGHFRDYLAHTPPKAKTPSGTKVTYTIARDSGFVLMTALSGQKQPPVAIAAARAHAASWGRCSQGEGHHCYAYAGWDMTYWGGLVEGAIDVVRSTWMNVPGWASGDSVTQEGWTAFEPQEYWIESGIVAGQYMDCCSIHSFWAKENGHGYIEGVAYWTTCCESTYQEHWMGESTWNTYWYGMNLIASLSGFPHYSNELDAGMEIAANTKPQASGAVDTAAWWTTGAEHNWSHEQWWADPGTCIGRDGAHPAVGNIVMGTCP